jgi:hypothetical protein
LGVTVVTVTLCARLKLPEPWATGVGCSLALATGVYGMQTLIRLVGVQKIDRYLRRTGMSFPLRK